MKRYAEDVLDFVRDTWPVWTGFGLLLLLVISVLVLQGTYMETHHCEKTGHTRPGVGVIIGNMVYPSTENEYVCDGGEKRWY